MVKKTDGLNSAYEDLIDRHPEFRCQIEQVVAHRDTVPRLSNMMGDHYLSEKELLDIARDQLAMFTAKNPEKAMMESMEDYAAEKGLSPDWAAVAFDAHGMAEEKDKYGNFQEFLNSLHYNEDGRFVSPDDPDGKTPAEICESPSAPPRRAPVTKSEGQII